MLAFLIKMNVVILWCFCGPLIPSHCAAARGLLAAFFLTHHFLLCVRCRMEHCRPASESARSSSRRSSNSPSVASQRSSGQDSPSTIAAAAFRRAAESPPMIGEQQRRRHMSSLHPAVSVDEFSRPHLPHCRLYRASDLLLYEKYKAGSPTYVTHLKEIVCSS